MVEFDWKWLNLAIFELLIKNWSNSIEIGRFQSKIDHNYIEIAIADSKSLMESDLYCNQ